MLRATTILTAVTLIKKTFLTNSKDFKMEGVRVDLKIS